MKTPLSTQRSAEWQTIEGEILIRAREATIAAGYTRGLGISVDVAERDETAIRAGQRDSNWSVLCAAQALRDIGKPLSEIQPIDPDVHVAAQLLLELNAQGVGPYQCINGILTAIKRGRDLERGK